MIRPVPEQKVYRPTPSYMGGGTTDRVTDAFTWMDKQPQTLTTNTTLPVATTYMANTLIK